VRESLTMNGKAARWRPARIVHCDWRLLARRRNGGLSGHASVSIKTVRDPIGKLQCLLSTRNSVGHPGNRTRFFAQASALSSAHGGSGE
jgi:hypothetical protein